MITQRTDKGVQLSELHIQSVKLGDAGNYTCNVSNPVGFAFQVKRLEVQGVWVCGLVINAVSMFLWLYYWSNLQPTCTCII